MKLPDFLTNCYGCAHGEGEATGTIQMDGYRAPEKGRNKRETANGPEGLSWERWLRRI